MTDSYSNSQPRDDEPVLPTGYLLSDDYRVVEHLNRGHVLDVYTVYSERRAVLCTAKLPRPSRADDEAEHHQLLVEGKLLTNYTHPHLVRGYELTDGPTGPLLIMETLTGATLSRLIMDHGGLQHSDVLVLADQLSSFLHYLHQDQMLHLDLKPSNIIATGGLARVIDLNLAHPVGTTGVTAGTAEYKAPEQIAGTELTTATDVWGLGGVLYRAATGHRPFAKEPRRDPNESPNVEPLESTEPHLAHLILDCLTLDPARRPGVAEIRSRIAAGDYLPDMA